MTLIRKAARAGDPWEGHLRIQEEALCHFEATLEQPAVRGPASRLPEGSGEVTARQTALACQLRDRYVLVEASVHRLLRTPFLPRSQASADELPFNDGSCICPQKMGLERQRYLVNEQGVPIRRLFQERAQA
jgi:hypothetical protein